MWPFKKKAHNLEVLTSEVPVTTMIRWFLHDVGSEGIDEVIGLSPVSDEGYDKEQQDSDERLIELEPIIPFIEFISSVAGNVLSTNALLGSNEEDLSELFDEDTEELPADLAAIYKSIAFSSILGAFSIASSLGLIQVTAVTSDLHDMEKFDE
jgi:hypothetical protein